MTEQSAPSAAPEAPAYVSDTSGMSETQAAAMAFVDRHRAELVKGTTNFQLIARNSEALKHALGGGPVPEWMSGEKAADPAAGNVPSHEAAPRGLAAVFEPMTPEQTENVRIAAGVYGVPPAEAAELAKFCTDAQIPATHSDAIARRVAHHLQNGGSMAPLSPEDQSVYLEEAARSFGGEDKLREVDAKARAYIESLGPAVVKYVDEKLAGTSIAFDPRVLNMLAGLADARGIKAK